MTNKRTELKPTASPTSEGSVSHAPMTGSNRFSQSRRMIAGALAAASIVGGTVAAVEYDLPDKAGGAMEQVGDIGVTVTPKVSSSGTEALIAGNNLLRGIGPYALLGGLVAFGGLAVARKRSDITAATYTYLAATKESGITYRVLPATIISSVAISSGLGDTAGKGANEPVRILAESSLVSTTGPQADPLMITQHKRVIPFNHSEIKKKDIATLTKSFNPMLVSKNSTSTSVMPFVAELGSVYDPSRKNNPSSAPIIALPNETIKKSMGVDLSNTNAGCSDTSVIVGSQLGSKKGDKIQVEGKSAKVAGTIEIAPGLDRVAVIGSLEQLHGCIFDEGTYSGAMVIGVDSKEQLQAQMDDLGMDYSARELDEVTKAYSEFWDRSVKPVEMQLILLVLGTGIAGVTYMRSSSIMRRRKEIATMILNGVDTREICRDESIRSLHTGVKAAGYAVIPAIALTAMTNSSQFGLDQPADISSLGAGFAAFMGVSIISNVNAKRTIKNMDAAQELRS